MNESNRVVSGLWICPEGRGALSNLERLCIHSFLANGHDFRLYAYGEISNTPESRPGEGGMELCDAEEILPADRIFMGRRNSFAPFADRFRWELMLRKGGWWVDMDEICIRPFDFAEDVVFGREDDYAIAIGALKFPAGHPVAEAMADACANPNRIRPWDTARRRRRKIYRSLRFWRRAQKSQRWGEAGGPAGFTLLLKHLSLENLAKPSHVFYPVHHTSASSLTDDSLHEAGMLPAILKHSHGVHFSNDGWAARRLDKNGVFAAHSPFEVLKRRYLPEYVIPRRPRRPGGSPAESPLRSSRTRPAVRA